MGGQIRRGRIWRFWGAPIFSREVPKYLVLKGFGTSGRKIGAPPKTPNSTTTDLTPHLLGCRKWGCNKWGFKGCLAALPGNRPKSPFFCLFRPFPEGAKSTWKIQKTEEKGLFPQISSDFLKPPSLKPPFAALQICGPLI